MNNKKIEVLIMVRFLMKNYAFLRTTVPKVLARKQHDENDFKIPSFSKIIYFYFAPTLIYKDKYPRVIERSWKNVGIYFLEIILANFLLHIVLDKIWISVEQLFVGSKILWNELIFVILDNILWGTLVSLLLFFIFLHALQNMFAEMLKFGDRLFYSDWWNSTTFQRYYRTWNIIVHDWIYTYVYQDVYMLYRNKFFSRAVVIFLSGIAHEYIISFTLESFIPMTFIFFFCFGVPLTLLKETNSTFGHILFLFKYGFGFSAISTMYFLEYHARMICPDEENTATNYIIPRIMRFNNCNL